MNVLNIRREIERQRLHEAQPWLSRRKVNQLVEERLSFPGHFAANKVTQSPGGLVRERGSMGRSNVVWARGGGNAFQIEAVKEDNSLGELLWENFLTWGQQTISTTPFIGTYVGGNGTPWRSSEGTTTQGGITRLAGDIPVGVTGSLIPPAVGLSFGAIEMATSATAHNECAMELGGLQSAAQGSFAVPSSAAATAPLAGQLPKLFYECRVRFPQAANMSAFLGLMTAGKAGHNTVFTVADVAAKFAAIGFWLNPVATTGMATSGTQLQPGYATTTNFTIANQAGFVGNVGGIPNTADYPGTSGSTAFPGTAVTSLSTDWTKLGFVVDAMDPAGVVIRFYQDGILLAQQTIAQIVAANWPSDVPLNPLFYIQAAGAGGAAVKLDLDWVGVGQILTQE